MIHKHIYTRYVIQPSLGTYTVSAQPPSKSLGNDALVTIRIGWFNGSKTMFAPIKA